MSRQELVDRALALRALKLLVEAEEKRCRAELEIEFTDPGDRKIGKIAGRPVGNVQLINGSSTWAVADYEAWLAWVQKHRPDEIVDVVRPSYTKAVLAKLAKGDALVDGETGELIVPDGIVPKHSDPSIRISPSEDAPGVLLQAMGDAAVLLGFAVAGEIE